VIIIGAAAALAVGRNPFNPKNGTTPTTKKMSIKWKYFFCDTFHKNPSVF
jgi:hypothetical protein